MYPKNIHDAQTYDALITRIEGLSPDAHPVWGKMNVAQMLSHCAEVLDVMNGKELKNTPFYIRLLGPMIKKAVLRMGPYSKDSPTHPQYIKSGPEDFELQRTRLIASLGTLRAAGSHDVRHPLFGKMTAEEVGWSAWKHLDHHLTQFGA